MDDHSKESLKKETDTPKEISVLPVLYSYGIFLFVGLLSAIFAHGIEDSTEFILFIIVSGFLYFLLVHLYFRGDFWRKLVCVVMCAIALISLFMVFYLQVQQ